MTISAVKIDDVYKLDVGDLTRAVASGTLTPTEVTEAFLARIEAVEPRVKAFTTLDPEGALAQAKALTAEARTGRLRGPLHGIPFGVKEVYHVAGMPTDGDVTLPKGTPQPADSTVVTKLKDAGAVLVGKLWAGGGITRNAWNLEHTPGGSSTGSGAAAGARELPFTIGEQTAGSHLRPAMFNGVVGFKPSFGRIGRFGLVLNAWSLDHVGTMAPSVDDTALVYAALAGPDPLDPSTLPDRPPPSTIDMTGFMAPRIGVIREFFMETSEPAMQKATEEALQQLAKAGAEVVDISLPKEFRLSWYAHGIIFATERATMKSPWREDGPVRGRAPSGRTLFMPDEVAPLIPTQYYIQSQRIRRYLQEQVGAIVGSQVNVLLTPTAAGPAPKASDGGGDPSFQSCWSLLGFPTIQVPNGLAPNGLPLGVQIIAPMLADAYILCVAKWTEGVLGRLPVVPLV